MDKIKWSTRQKATSDDLNTMVSDSEDAVNQTVNEILFDTDFVQNGFLASASGGNNSVQVASGRAYDSSGKRINLPAGVSLLWDGTNGQACNMGTNRKDLVSIKYKAADGNTQPRTFIDTDTSSLTYGEAYTSNVVVNSTDSYEFIVTSGTGTSEAAPTSVPFFPSGTIPLFTVNILSGTSTHVYTANVDNTQFGTYKLNSNVKNFLDAAQSLDGDLTDYSILSNVVGWSSKTVDIQCRKSGARAYATFDINGTSNSTSVSFTLPYAAASKPTTYVAVSAIMATSGTILSSPAMARISASSSTVNCYKDFAETGWMPDGNKRVTGQIEYETA